MTLNEDDSNEEPLAGAVAIQITLPMVTCLLTIAYRITVKLLSVWPISHQRYGLIVGPTNPQSHCCELHTTYINLDLDNIYLDAQRCLSGDSWQGGAYLHGMIGYCAWRSNALYASRTDRFHHRNFDPTETPPGWQSIPKQAPPTFILWVDPTQCRRTCYTPLLVLGPVAATIVPPSSRS